METNEQGLTREERIMFLILGVILTIALGVLIINSFSQNERKLNSGTPITETEKQDEAKSEENSNINRAESSLIEDTPVEMVKLNQPISLANITKSSSDVIKKTENKINVAEKEEVKEIVSILDSWNFKDTLITEAHTNDILYIDKNVKLNNGEEAEAQVTIRKLIDDTYYIIDISNGSIILTEGIYKYYYTYANITKTKTLIVKNYLNPTNINILELKGQTETITNENYLKLKEVITSSNVSLVQNEINLSLSKKSNMDYIPVVVTLDEMENIITVKSNTYGILPSNENNSWHKELTPNQFIIWIDLNVIDRTQTLDISLNINEINYIIKFNYIVNDISDKDSTEEDTKNEQDIVENDIKEELPDNQTDISNEDTLPKNNDGDQIPSSLENNTIDYKKDLEQSPTPSLNDETSISSIATS